MQDLQQTLRLPDSTTTLSTFLMVQASCEMMSDANCEHDCTWRRRGAELVAAETAESSMPEGRV